MIDISTRKLANHGSGPRMHVHIQYIVFPHLRSQPYNTLTIQPSRGAGSQITRLDGGTIRGTIRGNLQVYK